jgi:UDP-N-acetylglucosamine 1-carboxyvinyltransferase
MKSVPSDSYLVQGGVPLSGRLKPSGSKNAALPEMAAALLTDRPVTLGNLPAIRDVESMLGLLESAGVSVRRRDGDVEITASVVDPDRLDLELCRSIRASILLAGPLLARCRRLRMPPPGGDVIGRRRLDSHFLSLEAMGAEVEACQGYHSFRTSGLTGSFILLDEPSVTATENAMMAASVAKGTTVLYNAACEPNVQDLASMLVSMGASIGGAGTNRIVVEGRNGLLSGCAHRVAPDHIEIGSFIGLAACCRGGVTIESVPEDIVTPTMNGLGRFGIEIRFEDGDLVVPAGQDLAVLCDRGGAVPTIYDAPWPGFSPDLTSTAVVVATQARGTVLVFEKMFESRLFFVDKLVAMGASIIQCDPHRVVVAGPSKLHGTDVSSPDIRAGMALLTAALCAEGESVIRNVHQIERGYENLVSRLRLLGAQIEAGQPK